MHHIRLVLLVFFIVPFVYGFQNTPAPVTGGGRVHITGENPGIRLLDKQGGATLTDVNFWGVDWSPVGSGHVCFVTTRDAAGKIDLRLALYDNPRLVDFVGKETMGKLVQNFNDPPYRPLKATFTNTGDSSTERRQRCKSDEYDVELVWRDFNPGSWGEMRPPNGFHMTFFVITSRTAEVNINGKKAPGSWFPSSFPASYLAYAETWRIEPQQPAPQPPPGNGALSLPRPTVADTSGVTRMSNKCASNPPLTGSVSSSLSWNGWSPGPNNARFQTAESAGLKAADIPKLKLKWAFALPGGATSSSQPTVALGRVFVGSDNQNVYSLDAKTGCAYWAFRTEGPGRFAPIVAPISGQGSSRYGVFFVTSSGTAYAVDAQDGKELWRTRIEGLVSISGSSAYYDGRLYVPITGTETLIGANPTYECCRSRGGVAALDANTGKIIWKVDSIAEPVRKLGRNPQGTQLWGPAGAGVWNTPTIDAKRKRIYVGTGNSYGPIAAETSDSVLALNMDNGSVVWSHQEFKGDSFMVGCGNTSPAGGNCPQTLGPDWDFGGSSVIMERLADGRDILLAAGKGGVAIALDPDQNGKLIWRTKLYDGQPPSALGLVVFGGTADGQRAYYPLQRPGGGLTALQLENGNVAWTADIKADRRGQIGAASSIPGVVFTGAWDGTLRAVDTTGKVIWSFATNREFEAVNGLPAKGGSLGSPGPTIANGMLYVSSGYVGVQQGSPGNVVLAFGVD